MCLSIIKTEIMLRYFRFGVIAVFFAALWASCNENEPIIPPVGPQESGSRVVLIEEFTGVRCPNCPAGAEEIESLLALYPDNLVAVTIHAGSFAFAFDTSKYDFKVQEGIDITNALGGEPLFYPSAVIDRKTFGTGSLYLGKAEWAGRIQSELAQEPAVGLGLEGSYNPADRQLDITVTLLPNETLSGEINLTILVTESGMVDIQANELEDDGYSEDYVHKHVLRGTITPALGEPLQTPLSEGQPVVRSYQYTLPDEWVPDNCELVAFVHRSGSEEEVLQAARLYIED
jgi:hypothetical protein